MRSIRHSHRSVRHGRVRFRRLEDEAMKSFRLTVRAGALLAALLAAGPAAAQTTALPSPEQFFGFQMGADRKLAGWDKLHEYYQRLARSSDKLKLVELGKTSEGRPYLALFISSPANLARLDQYRQMNATLADPRGAPPGRSTGSSPRARLSSSRPSASTRPRSRRRRPRRSSSTNRSRGPTRKPFVSWTTSSTSYCRRSTPTAPRWWPTGT